MAARGVKAPKGKAKGGILAVISARAAAAEAAASSGAAESSGTLAVVPRRRVSAKRDLSTDLALASDATLANLSAEDEYEAIFAQEEAEREEEEEGSSGDDDGDGDDDDDDKSGSSEAEEDLAERFHRKCEICSADSKARTRLNKKYEEGSIDHENAALSVQIFEACEAMQVGAVPTMPIQAMLDNAAVIISSGVDFPFEHKARITQRMLSDALDSGRIGAWVTGLWPWADGDDAQWEPAAPTFKSCLPQSVEEAKAAKYFEAWQQTVLCEGFMKAVGTACDGGTGPAMVMKLSRTALEAFEASSAQPPDWAEEFVNPVLQVLQGVVAMTCPIPRLHGAKSSDVKYLFPDAGRNSMLLRDVPKMGKLIQNRIRTSSAWADRREAYLKRAPLEVGDIAQNFLLVHQKAARLAASLPDADPQEKNSVYAAYVSKSTQWVNSFRKGCTLEMQAAMLKLLTVDVDGLISAEPSTGDEKSARVSSAIVLRDTMSAMTIKGASELRDKLLAELSTWQDQEQRSKLDSAAEGFLSQPSVLTCRELNSAVEAAGEADHTDDQKKIMERVLQKSMDALTTNCDMLFWSVVYDMWEGVRSRNWFQPSSCEAFDNCSRWLRAMAPFAKFCKAADPLDAAVQDMQSDPNVLELGVIPAWEKYINAFKELRANFAGLTDKPDGDSGNDDGPSNTAAWQAFLANANLKLGIVKDELGENANTIAGAIKDKLQKALHFCEQVGGGATAGAKWYGDFNFKAGDLASHFAKTLEVTDTRRISRHLDLVEQASAEWDRHLVLCGEATYTIPVAMAPPTLAVRAQAAMKTVHTTIAEMRVMKIARGSGHACERLQSLSPEYTDTHNRNMLNDIGTPILDYLKCKGVVQGDTESGYFFDEVGDGDGATVKRKDKKDNKKDKKSKDKEKDITKTVKKGGKK